VWAVLASAVVLPAGLAWACVGVVSLTSESKTAEPGGTLTVRLREYAARVPVEIRLDSPTGRLLATAPGPDGTMTSNFTVDVPVPADITPGEHLLFASQDHHDMNSGAPARTVFYVGMAPPPTAAPDVRPIGMDSASGPSIGSLILIGLGVAAAGLLVAGAWSVIGARRSPGTPAEVGR
jgi:hypothetical protein